MSYASFNPAKPDPAADSGTALGNYTRQNLLAIRDMVTMGAMPGWAYSINGVTGTASISGTTMTVYGTTFGAYAIGQTLTGSGVTSDTTITGGSGSSWTVSTPQTVISTTISGVTHGQPENFYYTNGSEIIWGALTWGTSGGSAGNVTQIVYNYSANGGSTWASPGTLTLTYDAAGNCISTHW